MATEMWQLKYQFLMKTIFLVAYLDNLYHWIQMFKFLALPIIEMPDYFQGRNPMERKVRGTSLDLSEQKPTQKDNFH